jgi:hypothetical protein
MVASYTRPGSRPNRKEQLKNVEHTAFGVLGFKRPLSTVLNNAKGNARAWTPADDTLERKAMDPLMSLEGDEARFFEVVCGVVLGGRGLRQVPSCPAGCIAHAHISHTACTQ